MQKSSTYFRENIIAGIVGALFIVLTIWWAVLNPISTDPSLEHQKYIWGAVYQIIAIIGGILGLVLSKIVGGFKSHLGRAVTYFSIGLLLQAFGQSVYSYFNLIAHVQAPYPSLGDVGFFGSIFFYIAGAVYLLKVTGSHISLRSVRNKIWAIGMPVLLLITSYLIFLRHYSFDELNILKTVLDFGYPLGQAFYLSLAILALILSGRVMGGMMKKPILFFLLALVMQYVSDFNFLFHANNGTWFVGSMGDFLYMFSYLCMTFSIIKLSYVLKQIKES